MTQKSSEDITDITVSRAEHVSENPPAEGDYVWPAIDILENDREILITADLPGVERHNVDLKFDGERLSLRARPSPLPQSGLLVREIPVGSYARTLTIPHRIDLDKIAADLDRGVLRIRLPKAEAPPARRLSIKQ